MRFNRALSSNPVCSPKRATYLTGLMPVQPKSPGRDFSGILRGQATRRSGGIFYEMETTRAIRMGDG